MSTLNVSKNTSGSSSKMTLKSQKLLASALALVLVAGLASPAFALTIDNFEDGSTSISATIATSPQDNSEGGLDVNQVIGGDRYTKITYVSGPGGNTQVMADQLNLPPAIMGFSSSTGVTGDFYLRYDAGGSGLGGVDLTLGGTADRILLHYEDADLTSGTTITVMDQSGNTSHLMINLGMNGERTLEFPYADFVDDVGSADFTDIDKIEVLVSGVANGDYQVDFLEIPQRMVGGTVGSMDSVTLLVAGAQANMGLWTLALVGAVVSGGAIIYKTKSKKTEQ